MTGVGEKTALALLQGIGSIDEIAANLDKAAALGFRGSKAFADKFREQEEQVRLSYMLATIKTDVALDQSLEELQLGPIDKEALLAVYREYELRNLIKELESGGAEGSEAEGDDEGAAPVAAIETDYRCILDEAEFDEWLACLQAAPLFAFDTETTSLDYMEARVVGVSFAIEPGRRPTCLSATTIWGAGAADRGRGARQAQTAAGRSGPPQGGAEPQVRSQRAAQPRYRAAGHRLRHHARVLCAQLHCQPPRHGFAGPQISECRDHLVRGYRRQGVKQLTFNQIELEQAAPYAAEDADITLRLHQTLWGKLSAEPSLAKVFSEIELPLLPVLARMERLGTTIEPKLLHQQSQEIEARLAELEKQAHELAGQEFNLSSPKQLGRSSSPSWGCRSSKRPQGSAIHCGRGACRAGGDL